MEEDGPLSFGRCTPGKEYQVPTEQQLGASHSQTWRWEEKISDLPWIESSSSDSLASHCNDSIIPAPNITWQLDADASLWEGSWNTQDVWA
jgi:hypothetical protein